MLRAGTAADSVFVVATAFAVFLAIILFASVSALRRLFTLVAVRIVGRRLLTCLFFRRAFGVTLTPALLVAGFVELALHFLLLGLLPLLLLGLLLLFHLSLLLGLLLLTSSLITLRAFTFSRVALFLFALLVALQVSLALILDRLLLALLLARSIFTLGLHLPLASFAFALTFRRCLIELLTLARCGLGVGLLLRLLARPLAAHVFLLLIFDSLLLELLSASRVVTIRSYWPITASALALTTTTTLSLTLCVAC